MKFARHIASRFAFAAALTASAFAAQAAGFDFTNNHFPPQDQSQSTLTRAEVKAQVLDAISKGQMLSQGQSYLPLSAQQQQQQQQPASALSREQVRRETMAAEKAGLLDNYGA
ncbi:DUF4148 domain-containing protein [Comamonas fluminis]|uniref:DUF4148 domain-containing protein n=1 Tax=Comamonas fluminis TaxID=2796366 RepID=UPI001C48CB87|nr:DUF4148 domain-containing protein [Comamonas fluminis]